MTLQPAKLAYKLIANRRTARWLNVLLLLIAALWLAPFLWALLSPAKPAATPQTNAAPTALKTHYGQQIAALKVFGSVPVAPVEVEAKPQKLPLTQLNLVLKGVLANNPQQFAYALIAQGSGATEVYGIGDAIEGGAKLLEVFADRVIIEYNARRETLMLQELQEIHLGASAAPPVAANPAPSAPSTDGAVAINPLRASALRQEFLANPTKLLNMVSIKPFMQNGAMVGYAINPKGDPSLYNELGLRPNDVVMSVNGIGITDIPNLNKLTNAASYEVVLLRAGQQMSLSLNFE